MRPPWKKSEPERRLDWLLARLRTARAPARKPGIRGALGDADQAVLALPAHEGAARPRHRRRRQRPRSHRRDGRQSGLRLASREPQPIRRSASRWLIAAATGPAAVIVNYGVKLASAGERPLLEDHPPLAKAPSKLSFPSAHSTSSMAAATAFGRVDPRTRFPSTSWRPRSASRAPTWECTIPPTSSPVPCSGS